MAVVPFDDDGEFTMETRDVSPAHFLLKIESFPLLSQSGIRKFESKEFAAGDYKWAIKRNWVEWHGEQDLELEHFETLVYPDGLNNENDSDHISVYLATAGTSSLPDGWEVHATFSIFLYNQIMDNYLCFQGKVRRFNAMKSIWGSSKLISKNSLTEPTNGFLVDDNCVFGAEVFVIENQRSVQWFSPRKMHSWIIPNFSKLKDYCSSEEFTAGGCKWKINLYPNGYGTSTGKDVSIFLCCSDFLLLNKVEAEFCIRIKNQLDCIHVSGHATKWFASTGIYLDSGWISFVPIDDMLDPSLGLVVDDCCIVETEVTVLAAT